MWLWHFFPAKKAFFFFFWPTVPLPKTWPFSGFYFYIFSESGFILFSFSPRCCQVWMNKDILLGHLMFLWLERRERSEAKREVCRGLPEMPLAHCGKSGIRAPPLMGIIQKRAWGVDSNNWACQHAQKPSVFTPRFSKGWTHLPNAYLERKYYM